MKFPDFSSTDLNPMDFCIWSVLERNACSKPHRNLKSLKKFLVKKWDKIPQKTLRISVESVPKRLKAVSRIRVGMLKVDSASGT